MNEPRTGEGQDRVRLLYKIIAYVAIWIVALLLTAPGHWALAWMFPLGLVAVFDRHTANTGGWGFLIGCYAIYLIHGFFYFRSKTTTQTMTLYGILVVLLIGNVAGCRQMINVH